MKKLLNFLILLMMGLNGILCLGWFLTPPNPDRVGFWYLIFFFVHPCLGLLGITSLLLKKSLNLSWWLGSVLLGYVIGWLIVMFVLATVDLGLPANFSFEVFYTIIWLLTLIIIFCLINNIFSTIK